jgi:hypothetical protein
MTEPLETAVEVPEDDAAEQAAAVDRDGDELAGLAGLARDHEHDSLEVDPADRADQDREVALGDDEYR